MDTWSQIAERYHQFVDSKADKLRTELLYPQLWQAMHPLTSKRVLDIGCGNGFFAFHTAVRQAQVEAFDNAAMISIAKLHFSHPEVNYNVGDANKSFLYEDASFDYTCANLVLMDIAEITTLLQESKRVLKSSGQALFTILHPCFTPPVGRFRRGIRGRFNQKHAYFHLNNYFTPPSPIAKQSFGQDIPATNYYHRTISEYTRLFQQEGFNIVTILEPRPNDQFIKQYPHFFHAQKISIFCTFILTKAAFFPRS